MNDRSEPREGNWLDRRITDLLTPRNLILALLAVLSIWFLFAIRAVLVILGIAGTTAFILSPVVKWLVARRIPKKRAVFLIFLTYIVLLLGLFASLYSQGVGLYQSLASVSADLLAERKSAHVADSQAAAPEGVTDDESIGEGIGSPPESPDRVGWWENTSLGDWLNARGMDVGDIERSVGELIQQNAGAITRWLLQVSRFLFGGLGLVFTAFSLLILVPILAYYLLVDGRRLRDGLLRLLPERHTADADTLLDRIEDKLGVLIRGQIKLCMWITVLSWIALLLIGVKHWFVLGVIAGITEFIPTVGPVIGALPAVVVGFIQGPITGVWVIVAYLLVQFVENNVLVPRIMGKDLGLHPLLVMLVLMSGGVIGGVMGMLLALPCAALVKVLYDEYYRKLMGDDVAVEETA